MPALSIKIVCFPLFLKRLVQFDKTGGKQNAADNVGYPMYAGNQAAYCHKHSKRDKKKGGGTPESDVSYSFIKLHNGRQYDAKNKQRGRRRIRRLQISAYQNRPVIDNDRFEKKITRRDRKIKRAKYK